ncbi:MAG: hypothetical protein WBS14_23020, partial [Rhodomicrobium sp.]
LDKNGQCGSAYFHIPRTAAHFKEMVAMEISAWTLQKTVTLFVTSCVKDRNIISGGYATR